MKSIKVREFLFLVLHNSNKSIDNIAPRDVSPLQKYIPFSIALSETNQAQSELKLVPSSKIQYEQSKAVIESNSQKNEMTSPLNAGISPIIQMESPDEIIEADTNKETTPQTILTKIDDFIERNESGQNENQKSVPELHIEKSRNLSSSESSGLSFSVIHIFINNRILVNFVIITKNKSVIMSIEYHIN